MLPDSSVDQFYQYLKHMNGDATASKYRLAAQKFIAFVHSNGIDMKDLPPGVLSLFSEVQTAYGLKATSVATMTAGAKRFLKWLQDRGAITIRQLNSPDLPKIIRDPPNDLRDEDLLEYFRWSNQCQEPARTALLLLPYCGLRSDELTNLTMSSISQVGFKTADGKTIGHICLTVRGKGGELRTVPLLLDGPPILRRYLRDWRTYYPGLYLFPESEHRPLPNRTLRENVQWVREQMIAHGRNPSRLTPHTLRRTYGTSLWKAGLDATTIAKIMGHKKIQTTMDHYLVMRPSDLAGAVHGKGVSLIAQGPYADKVREAQGKIGDFLDRLQEADERDGEGAE